MMIASLKEKIKDIPGRSVKFFMFCLTGVLIFVFGGIVPSYWNRVVLDRKINEVRYRIEESEALQPLYRSMLGAPGGASADLTIPPRVALQRNQIDKADASFRDIAGRYGMKVMSIAPNLVFTGDSRVLVVNVSLKGDFENFRNVLKKIGELPYVDHIEEFAMKRTGNSRALDIMMRITLVVS